MHLLRDKPAGRFGPAHLFHPDSIVVIGAGTDIGAQALANLRAGGFKGGIAVIDAVANVAALAAPADLAVFAAQPTLGHAAMHWPPRGPSPRSSLCAADALTELSRQSGVRMLGPDSFGIVVPGIGLNASRAHLPPPAGRVGLVSQSARCAAGARLGATERRRLQPYRRHRRPCGYRLRRWCWTGCRAIPAPARSCSRSGNCGAAAPSSPPPAPRPGCGRWWRSVPGGMLHADPTGAADRAFEAALRRAGVLCVTAWTICWPLPRRWPAPGRCAPRR